MNIPKPGAHHKRIKEKYKPEPNARELRHHDRLIAMPCICCGKQAETFHHLLSNTPEKRFRRDHELGLPLTDKCHKSLHGHGDEWAWCMARGIEPVREAIKLRDESRVMGIL